MRSSPSGHSFSIQIIPKGLVAYKSGKGVPLTTMVLLIGSKYLYVE